MRVVALAGGVGGAKLADGLARVLPAEDLTVVVNTGDDFTHLGLKICPDLDTVCYTLAGIASRETGWGRADESFHALESLAQLGGPNWFRLGDRDIGLHLERTRRLNAGEKLSKITEDFCKAWGIGVKVLPMSDEAVSTWVYTEEGVLGFQEYFVYYRCEPKVTGFKFSGIEATQPAPGVIKAIHAAEVVVICPSNPWVSIDPILSLPGVRQALQSKPVLAVSPIIGGRTIKGPAAKMYAELGIEPSALAVCRHYKDFLRAFVLDEEDRELAQKVQAMGVKTLVTQTIMRSDEERRGLADVILKYLGEVTP
jgi:LPPG:FO 2-phospho-L-lactate transferase